MSRIRILAENVANKIASSEGILGGRSFSHGNPIAAHLVLESADWPYSSANGRFALDSPLEPVSSGAKALSTAGLYVGAKAPTP